MYDLIVIGGGPGGYEAAAHAGSMGKKVAVAEKDRVGGACLNVGCIPTKTLLKSARVLAECRGAARFGVHTGEARLDLPEVMARKNRIVATLTRGVEGLLKRSGVETIRGHARLAARDQVAVDGRTYQAANILIATGSRPAVPPIAGIAAAFDSTAALELKEAPASIAIIGGGYIGLEFASFFAAIGSRVTVLEMLPHIARGVDRDIAGRLADSLKKAGVTIRTDCRVNAVEELEAACVLNATGRAPVVDDLGLERLGVDYTARGIRTSEEGRTNIPGVWACGDVTGRRLLAHAATREGIVAVNNMFGARDRIRYESIPSVIYTHPEVASVGWTEEQLQERGIEYRKSMAPMAAAGRYLVENEGAPGMIKVLAGARHGEILGVHALGDAASEFIVLAAALIELELRARDVERIVFPHPTVSEALKAAIAPLAH